MPTTAPYVDLYLLPVPRANLEAYRDQAATFAAITREHGALSYREFLGDDTTETMPVEDGTVLTAAVVEFSSRRHRDEVMATVMADPRVEAMVDVPQPADMSRMRYGGFAPFVTA